MKTKKSFFFSTKFIVAVSILLFLIPILLGFTSPWCREKIFLMLNWEFLWLIALASVVLLVGTFFLGSEENSHVFKIVQLFSLFALVFLAGVKIFSTVAKEFPEKTKEQSAKQKKGNPARLDSMRIAVDRLADTTRLVEAYQKGLATAERLRTNDSLQFVNELNNLNNEVDSLKKVLDELPQKIRREVDAEHPRFVPPQQYKPQQLHHQRDLSRKELEKLLKN